MKSNEKGFSLIELMIVIVVIGILATIAIPRYFNVTRKAKKTEAKMMLNQVIYLQESYYSEHDFYAKTLTELEFEQEKLISEDGKARYVIKIEKADLKGFTATATSIVDYDKDGIMNVWQATQDGKITEIVAD